MSRKRFATLFTFAACAACLARPASAQLGGQDLPDLSGLAGAIADSVKAPAGGAGPATIAPPKKRAPGTLYRSGLVVPSVHPGETARGIGRQLREKIEAKSGPSPAFQKIEDGMPAQLAGFESYMEKHGVAKRDMGVAIGVFIELNWETATKQQLSETASANVVQVFSIAMSPKLKPRYAAIAPEAKEKEYETLLVSPMVLSALAAGLDKANKPQEAATIRASAASAFTQLTGMAPSQVQISADGRTINIKAKPTPPADAPPADAPPTDAPPADAPPTDAPAPAPDAPAGAPGGAAQ